MREGVRRAVVEVLGGRGGGMFAMSYYPTLISIKLDLTTHSLGFKWSKSFFIWQSGFPHHLLCYPIYYHWHSQRLGLWCLHSQVIDTNNEKDGGSQQGDPKQFPLSFSAYLAQFISYTLTLSPFTSSRKFILSFFLGPGRKCHWQGEVRVTRAMV